MKYHIKIQDLDLQIDQGDEIAVISSLNSVTGNIEIWRRSPSGIWHISMKKDEQSVYSTLIIKQQEHEKYLHDMQAVLQQHHGFPM